MPTQKTKKPAQSKKKPSGPKPGHVYVLRVVNKYGRSYNDFQWPEKGEVSAPDWEPTAECGHGLHGWLRGEGDASVATIESDGLWQVVDVKEPDVVDLGGKVKFPRGVVVFTGSQLEATKIIQDAYPGSVVIGGTATAGDSGTATAGDRGTATAGVYGTVTAGNYGTATAGDSGTATAGNYGTLVLRYWDSRASRYRLAVGYPGENGIKANTKYILNAKLEFEEVT